MDLVRNYEVSETLPSLQANKLAYYGFMDVGRRLQTETKDFITHINNSSPQHFPESQFLQEGEKRARCHWHTQ